MRQLFGAGTHGLPRLPASGYKPIEDHAVRAPGCPLTRFYWSAGMSIPLPAPAPWRADKRQSVCLCVCLVHHAVWVKWFYRITGCRLLSSRGVVGVSSKKKKKKKYRYIPYLLPSFRMSLTPQRHEQTDGRTDDPPARLSNLPCDCRIKPDNI